MKLKNLSVISAAKRRSVCGINASAAAQSEKTDFDDEPGILELQERVRRAIPCH
jgi:hypothetical protein